MNAKLPPPSTPAKLDMLLVEDNADQWFMTQSVLNREFPQIQPVWLDKAGHLLSYLETTGQDLHELPALILLDLYVHDAQTGFSLLHILKTHHLYKKIPTIVLSQSRAIDDVVRSYQLGSNGYTNKPATYEGWVELFLGLGRYWWNTGSESQ
ncbi:response regulator [Spirosoma oryzicola]|uniref:response regulator n=1 Tax=Spirosoma oryzicola TaxID=2898794 RepID=UPI001E5378E9|nr:response regulator [Spirosoma oryzicola]UHG94950.1 response regulator [Spirosoma oryzicola]